MNNPYLKYIIDESSGQKVTNQRYQDWNEGHLTGIKRGIKLMVKQDMNVIRAFKDDSLNHITENITEADQIGR